MAELVDNALAFSPPTERVVVTGRHAGDGRYGVVVEDVTRVLVADLYTVEMIGVHDVADPTPDVALLHRLIERVKAIA